MRLTPKRKLRKMLSCVTGHEFRIKLDYLTPRPRIIQEKKTFNFRRGPLYSPLAKSESFTKTYQSLKKYTIVAVN